MINVRLFFINCVFWIEKTHISCDYGNIINETAWKWKYKRMKSKTLRGKRFKRSIISVYYTLCLNAMGDDAYSMRVYYNTAQVTHTHTHTNYCNYTDYVDFSANVQTLGTNYQWCLICTFWISLYYMQVKSTMSHI